MNPNDETLVKAISCRVILVMNVYNLRKGDIEELHKIIKSALRKEGFHRKQAKNERLFMKQIKVEED